jgi:hypothetical protein
MSRSVAILAIIAIIAVGVVADGSADGDHLSTVGT